MCRDPCRKPGYRLAPKHGLHLVIELCGFWSWRLDAQYTMRFSCPQLQPHTNSNAMRLGVACLPSCLLSKAFQVKQGVATVTLGHVSSRTPHLMPPGVMPRRGMAIAGSLNVNSVTGRVRVCHCMGLCRPQLCIALVTMMFQQWTGINAGEAALAALGGFGV